MIKNLVESTFQRASVAADYDELTVSVGKLRMQVNDLRHVMRDMHQEMERMRAELRELSGLRAEIEAMKAGGVVLTRAETAPVAPAEVAAPAAKEPAKAAKAPAKAPAAKVEPAKVEPAKVEPAKVEPARVEVVDATPAAPTGIAAAVAQAAASGPPPVVEPDFGIRQAADGSMYWGPIDNASARAKAAGKTLIIDQLECISCGTCVEQTDLVFILPDDAKAVAKEQEGPMDAIQDAIDACPVTCIHWTEQPGQFAPLNDATGRKLAS